MSRFLRRWVDAVGHQVLLGLAAILRALPSAWLPPLADALGRLLWALDRRGRRAGRQNLGAVFGDALDARAQRRILLASYRNSVRSVALLLHVSPLTPARLGRWVEVPPEAQARAEALLAGSDGLVVVSGHIGCWELLLGLPGLFGKAPDLLFLAQSLAWEPLDRWLAALRGTGGGTSTLRHGGARALSSHVRRGGVAALLADRNARRSEGGVWAPFLGLQARSTPLPGWLAVRHRVPVVPVLCLPQEDGRCRLWVGPDLAHGVDRGDPDAAIAEITRRVNQVLESAIRARPGIWNWTLKRFESRPDRELGPYPPYSLWDA